MLFQESDIQFASSKKRKQPKSERPPNARQRILVVEDDPDIRRLNTEILTYSGYQVDAANGGVAAWFALEQNNYDLIVTDNNMPNGTGVDLIKKLRAHHLAIPVVMATGTVPPPDALLGHAITPVVMLKPYEFEDLLKTVKNALSENNRLTAGATPPPNWRGTTAAPSTAAPARLAATPVTLAA